MARKAPKWFTDAVRAERSTWYGDKVGQKAAAERLAALVLANPDQRFAASIVADFAALAVAAPPSSSKSVNRMSEAAYYRDKGLSLRQTAAKLGVAFATVRNDLRRWDAERANVSELCTPAVQSQPEITQPADTPAAVLPFRRTS